MDVPDWLIIYAILGMAIMAAVWSHAYTKLDPKYGQTERMLMTMVMWLLSSVVWPLYLAYALFVYKPKK